jgi:hypothetical protein
MLEKLSEMPLTGKERKELLDFDIEVNDIFEVVSHNYQKGGETYHVLLLCYLCTHLRGQPRAVECNDMKWVGPDEIGGYDFAAADIPIVAKVRNCLFHAS